MERVREVEVGSNEATTSWTPINILAQAALGAGACRAKEPQVNKDEEVHAVDTSADRSTPAATGLKRQAGSEFPEPAAKRTRAVFRPKSIETISSDSEDDNGYSGSIDTSDGDGTYETGESATDGASDNKDDGKDDDSITPDDKGNPWRGRLRKKRRVRYRLRLPDEKRTRRGATRSTSKPGKTSKFKTSTNTSTKASNKPELAADGNTGGMADDVRAIAERQVARRLTEKFIEGLSDDGLSEALRDLTFLQTLRRRTRLGDANAAQRADMARLPGTAQQPQPAAAQAKSSAPPPAPAQTPTFAPQRKQNPVAQKAQYTKSTFSLPSVPCIKSFSPVQRKRGPCQERGIAHKPAATSAVPATTTTTATATYTGQQREGEEDVDSIDFSSYAAALWHERRGGDSHRGQPPPAIDRRYATPPPPAHAPVTYRSGDQSQAQTQTQTQTTSTGTCAGRIVGVTTASTTPTAAGLDATRGAAEFGSGSAKSPSQVYRVPTGPFAFQMLPRPVQTPVLARAVPVQYPSQEPSISTLYQSSGGESGSSRDSGRIPAQGFPPVRNFFSLEPPRPMPLPMPSALTRMIIRGASHILIIINLPRMCILPRMFILDKSHTLTLPHLVIIIKFSSPRSPVLPRYGSRNRMNGDGPRGEVRVRVTIPTGVNNPHLRPTWDGPPLLERR
ncbi:hypothetical protein F5Y17DRAFT_461738 [Xylariaceae sp. FL0594]|nr:hypothetical protein F5Y17DRAFT_461738 [Xylariaceae sp. FL0594]